jgi:peptidyl-dipeptidase Dcp
MPVRSSVERPSATPPGVFTPSNPFALASTLLHQAPPFDRIADADYGPALAEGMRRQLTDMDRIAGDGEAPTFENTIIAMERSGELLTRVSRVFSAVTGANSNDTLRVVEKTVAPLLAAHHDAVHLHDALFQRVARVHERREASGLDAVQKYLIERYYRDFVRAGARLPDGDKTRLRALNREESELTNEFQSRLLAATTAGAIVVDDVTELEGLSEGDVSAAAEAARERNLEGRWVLPLHNTTQQPAQAMLARRAMRERIFRASTSRAEHGDGNDTRVLIARLAQLRGERAGLLGYRNHAEYVLDDQMARTPDAAIGLLTALVVAAAPKARAEAARMQAMIDAEGGGFALAAWDWQFYAERVRAADYAVDESQVRPYFELDRVLSDGVFYAATQLYGLDFRERTDLPVYHPDVRVFEVFDADGTSIALWYCDYFSRDNKNGGAWADTLVDGSGLLNTRPVVYNVANFSKPAPGRAALLTRDDVTTMFHEFGHSLHAMLTRAEFPRFSGTNVPTDFVELPSQFNEHWALYPSVLSHYAKHYLTGEPIPQSLVEDMKKASTFNQGFATTEIVAAALLDMAWHTLRADEGQPEVDAFEAKALARGQMDVREVPPRYRSSYFAHIWRGGYDANYYAYLWSEVLDAEAFAWFCENGGMTRANGQRFRELILSRGGTVDAAFMFRAFRGRDPDMRSLLAARGLESRASTP